VNDEWRSSRIPALSIRQPWAELIVRGSKTMEIRSWTTRYRGPLYIHAAKHYDLELERRFGLNEVFHGGFIGGAQLDMIVALNPRRFALLRDQHLSAGSAPAHAYGWVLSKPCRLRTPLPARGRVGLFYPDDGLAEALAAAERS
jgi:hypothetical protein